MHPLIHELKDIMRLLDRFVGHYPIYLYLVDSSNTVAWFNRYMSEMLPEIHVGQKLPCKNALLPCDEDCIECITSREDDWHKHPEKRQIKTSAGSGTGKQHLEFFNLPVYQEDDIVKGALRIGMDVTDNERIQEKLREKEKRFSAIVKTSTDAIIFLDNEERIINWNKGAEEIFGYTEAEIIGQHIKILMPEELLDLGELSHIRNELNDKGALKKFETQRRHKDGRLVYVDISSSLIYDEKGKISGASEIIKDIDARKALEFELLRTILELSKLNELNEILHRTYEEREILRIILIAITAGEGLRFNRAFILMLDKEEQTLKGHLAIGPSDAEEASRIWSELNQDYHYLRDIIQIYKIDLEGADKKVNEIVSQIEIPLSHQDHILTRALNSKRVIYVKDGEIASPATNIADSCDSDLIDLLKNDTFVAAPVYSKTEPLGVIIADNCINRREITPEDIEGLKLFASHASSAIENARLYRKLEDRIQEAQDAYKQLAENQEKLLRAERLATIGEMSAKIAHEIRNPLVSIGGFARLIERKIPENSQVMQYARIISEQVSHLENILGNILNVANPPEPVKQQVNINKVLRQVLEMMAPAIRERQHRLVEILADQPLLVNGDEKMLHQAFLNVIKNGVEALEHRKADGEIRIHARSEDGNVVVEITDNGPGIEKSLLGKIFSAFFTTKSGGTGLGLSIVNQIVESHNGRIDVTTQSRQGSTFHILLPEVVGVDTVDVSLVENG